MAEIDRTTAQGATIHVNDLCDHEDATGIRCNGMGRLRLRESKTITLWDCGKHQPLNYRGLPPHGSAPSFTK
ncbi:hypothetical protein QA644_34725 (plasmid) [Rhizobium sp. CC1099]|uniref:hypothetical protein n=1 Tax=Rhizobium sp. CC1099 TaxID=3039160 RepID=UPI0024B163CD|nr:hypothetical protein [Rhizobium sp. CC1099]WFU92048.1 hypothetical protein QA644_34725 [Rhizobium sp. CC1099]